MALALAATGCGGTKEDSKADGGGGGAGSCSIEPPVLTDHRLRANGTRFEDALGRTVVLRGVNAGGRSKFAPFTPFEVDGPAEGAAFQAALADYLDRAASWGIDVLRVPFTWEAVEPAQGQDDEGFLKKYDALLDGAWARGMFTVVDFHQDVYAQAYCGDGFPPWTLPASAPAPHHDCSGWGIEYENDAGVRAAFDAFWADGSAVRAAYESLWDRMVTRYRDKPGVIGFEVLNEPGWGTADPDAWEASTLTDFYSRMAARVAALAPDALVFFDATGTDAIGLQTTMKRPVGTNLVFAPHYYQVAALFGGTPSGSTVIDDLRKWQAYGDQWSIPVFLGEFGASNAVADGASYMSDTFAALDSLGMSGTEWEYSVANELWNGEDLSLVAGDGTENPMAAGILRPYAKALAGTSATLSFDAASRELSLDYVPSMGVTEIVLPERAYPKGYTVAVEGACADSSRAESLLVKAGAGATKVTLRVRSK